MALRTYRFGVCNEQGARSSEWVVMWKTNTSDVYLGTRTLGGSMKASFHASGRCHVRAPDPTCWRGLLPSPKFLIEWNIDPASHCCFPFAVVIPETELRAAEWAKHKDKGTVWIPATQGKGTEVAVFLIRAPGDHSGGLQKAGWHHQLVDAALPDGRRLLIAAGDSVVHQRKLDELLRIKAEARRVMEKEAVMPVNPRLVLIADADENGTRKFVEAAVLE